MYGTVARMRLKPGMQQQLREYSDHEAHLNIPGFIGQYVFQMDDDPNEAYLIVLFDSKESYFANADSPEQDARYRRCSNSWMESRSGLTGTRPTHG